MDPDNRDINVSSVSNAANGRVSLEDGTVTYEHDGSETTAGRFTYTISDGTDTDSAVVEIEVLPVNDQPLGVPDSDSVVEGEEVSIPASALIRNDVDPEDDVLRITEISEPLNGTVWLEGETITFSHDGSETSMAGFTYTVSDGIASDTVEVSLGVIPSNDPPTGVMDSLALEEGGSISVSASSLFQNDLDPEGDQLSVVSVAYAVNGTIRLEDNSVVYEHDGSETTTGGFTYTLSDGELEAMVDVSVTVTPVNDAPVADVDSFMVKEGGSVSVDASTLLTNDTDAENDTLMIVAVGEAVNGMVFLDGTTIIYEHDDSDTLTGSFSYTVSDGTGADTTTVEITVTPVEDAPAGTDAEATPPPTPDAEDSPTQAPDAEDSPTQAPDAEDSPAQAPDAESTDAPTPSAGDGGINIVLIVVIVVVVAAVAVTGIIFVTRRRRPT